MSSEGPITPFVSSYHKPPAKLASPVARNLFGRSQASAVTQMLNEIIVAEQKRGFLKLNFDIQKEQPMKLEQQENVADIDKTCELRPRFHWKPIRDGDVPAFYSRRYKGRKSLMPVDLLECSEDEASPSRGNGRSRHARRSLNGFLRTTSKDLSPKPIVRPASTSKFQALPVGVSSPMKLADSPVAFDDSVKHLKAPLSVLRPLPLHASIDNHSTIKFTSPVKPAVSPLRTSRSPLNLRENESRCVRAINFDNKIKPTSLFRKTSTTVYSADAQRTPAAPCPEAPGQAESSITPSRATPSTPAPSSSRPLIQSKITDSMQSRKVRNTTQKVRKRLNMSQDDASPTVPSSKMSRIV